MPDLLLRGVDQEAGLRIVVAVTTDLVRESARRQGALGIGACALGRGLTAGALVATLTRGSERVTLQIRGDGPLGGVVVDADVGGSVSQVRGCLLHPDAATGAVEGRARVAPAIGKQGVVNVLRDVGLKERYQGQVPLLCGEIDEDVESYLRASEQVPSALGCEVLLGGGAVVAAAGVLIQTLPGGDDMAVRPAQHRLRTGALHDFLAGLPAGSDEIRVIDPRALAGSIHGGAIEFLSEQPVAFGCRCSSERVEAMLATLGAVDIDEMIAERGEAEVTCNFCGTRYVVERPALDRIRERTHGPRKSN